MTVSTSEGRRILLRGTVQGVGMRPWIYRVAVEQHITGTVCNEASGVTIEAFGEPDRLDAFSRALGASAPPAARVEMLQSDTIPPRHAERFEIIDTRGGDERRVSIPPDLATCDDCVAEIFDPSDRRYGYPFTNCTNCGPRFTITTDVPYDRPMTTMRRFTMCGECQREYDDPANRRFHAQPNACPACGPVLRAVDVVGRPLGTGDPIRVAAEQILKGRIAAVKGIGGFHLACDATSAAAVARLRARKHRDEKPFAVMVRTLADAERLAAIGPTAAALLTSVERPIVLVPALAHRDRLAPASGARQINANDVGVRLCDEVAPGNPLIGLMLAYTPLHHLLLEACGRPLVMTSANLSDEPIVYRDHEALQRLHGIADLVLTHDREIVTRCDDSVAVVIIGAGRLIRRSRGYVPRAIALRHEIQTPVLATGALLKNTFCLARGREAFLGPHIGDLENAETYAAFEDAIDRMERFLGFKGEVIAHDLHPDYLSTRYARARAGANTVAVQHHHAHIASAVAELGLEGVVLGVAFDGTGYGPDGTAWGGEFLLVSGDAFERVATFRPLALAGGDAAIRQPWRLALAAIDDAFGLVGAVDDLPLFRQVCASDVLVVRQMLARGVNTPLAHGVGRYFDAFGALTLARPRARYEGQVAFELNMALDPREDRRYDFAINRTLNPMQVDLRPAVREAVRDIRLGTDPAIISARFHNTLIAATAGMLTELAARFEPLPVVLSGGCFQNARLAEGIVAALPSMALHLHRQVPCGDGGIALGQALVAGGRAR